MRKASGFCPEWAWWVRAGERLCLGLDLREVLRPAGPAAGAVTAGLAAVRAALAEGSGLVEALRHAGLRLPAEAWCLLESGEQTGRLGEALQETGNLLRQRRERRRAIAGQLWYPALVVATGLLVMGIILLFVVPRMEEISAGMGLQGGLPWLTRHIGPLYGGLTGLACGLGLLGAAAAGLVAAMGRRSTTWARFGERTLDLLPVAGSLHRMRREARLLRQLGTLLQAGVTLPRALEMAAQAVASSWERAQLMEFRARLLMGSGFASGLAAFPLVAEANRPLLLAGQESGKLDAYLLRVASDGDAQLEWRLQQAVRLLEPALLFGLTFAIGGLVLAYLLPMIRMLEQLA